METVNNSFNNKIIVLTENKRLYYSLTNIINANNCSIETSLPALTDLNLIKTQIKASKNTFFIKDAYNEFLKRNGYNLPLAIVIDYRIDLGMDKSFDPDRRKILKTILLSSVIFTKSENFKENDCHNFIFIGDPKDTKELEIYKDYPYIIFKTFTTTDATINSLLENYIHNPDLVKKLFYFNYILVDETKDVVKPAQDFDKILKSIIERNQKKEIIAKVKEQTPILEGNFEPAKVMYKVSDVRLYVDGKIYNIEGNPKFAEYKNDVIYIVGHYVNSTIAEVNRKIEKFLSEDLPKIKKVTNEDKIVFSINSHTIIDGATTHALNLLISYKFAGFKNISILTSETNYKKMENSPGFISLKKFLNVEKNSKVMNTGQHQ